MGLHIELINNIKHVANITPEIPINLPKTIARGIYNNPDIIDEYNWSFIFPTPFSVYEYMLFQFVIVAYNPQNIERENGTFTSSPIQIL